MAADLEARRLGTSDLAVSIVGLGAGELGRDELGEREAERLLRGALDLGVNLIDAAPSYGSAEARLGRYLAACRDQVVLSTKLGYGVAGVPDWRPETIRLGVERALALLRTDRLDLALLHSCPLGTLRESGVVEALAREVETGRVRLAGYSGENEALAWAIESGAFAAVMLSLNPFDQGSLATALPAAHARRLAVLAKRPLGNAVWRFARRPERADLAEYWDRRTALGLDFGSRWPEVALRFSAFAPGVTSAVVGTSSLERLGEAVAAARRGPLPPDEEARIAAAWRERALAWHGLV